MVHPCENYLTRENLDRRLRELSHWAHLYNEWVSKTQPARSVEEVTQLHMTAAFLFESDFKPLFPEKSKLTNVGYIEECLSELTSNSAILHCREGKVLGQCNVTFQKPSEIQCGEHDFQIVYFQQFGAAITDNQYVMTEVTGAKYPISELYTIDAKRVEDRINLEYSVKEEVGRRLTTSLVPDIQRRMDAAYIRRCLDRLAGNEMIICSREEEILTGCRLYADRPSNTPSRMRGLNLDHYFATRWNCLLNDNQFTIKADNGSYYPVSELFIVKVPTFEPIARDLRPTLARQYGIRGDEADDEGDDEEFLANVFDNLELL